MSKKQLKIVAAAVGNCVHVAGTIKFLQLATHCGYETHFLGPAISVTKLLQSAIDYQADIVGVSFRLTPSVAENLFLQLYEEINKDPKLQKMRFVCGCTPSVAAVAHKYPLFEDVFTGEEPATDVLAYLRGEAKGQGQALLGSTLLQRIENKRPYPLLRHHFGLPSVKETTEGIAQIARAQVLDVISIGPDQNAQFAFFRPEEMDPKLEGAGGVALRQPADLAALHQAAQQGNHPLLRCYSGTRDLLKWAELSRREINNAWAAIPLCWYSNLDGRSTRPVYQAIVENQKAMQWHAKRGIPVEVNEAHHWSLREAPDAVAVAMAYIAAYTAKAMGVKHYVAQYMFNTPVGSWYNMDIAKMLAKAELIAGLEGATFRVSQQVRTGLASLSTNMNVAKGQLASSIHLALSLKPDIVHVVGYSEANHAATAKDVIESCQITNGVLENSIYGLPDVGQDPVVDDRKEQLLGEARQLLKALHSLGIDSLDPLTDPRVIARAIDIGLLDAPHLQGGREGLGQVQTRIIDGKCVAVDEATGSVLDESERISRMLNKVKAQTIVAD